MSCFYPADILLPKNATKEDMEKWAVIACDQYTSDEEYWEDVKEIVGDAPSTLNIMLPEIYLEKDNTEKIKKINATMQEYLDNDMFEEYKDAMIYVERQVGDKVRKGLVGMVDLEEYDYTPGSQTLIRATEATIIDRLPPRIEIRKNAPLEMPHILMLFNDANKTIVAPLEARKGELEVVYDFDLMKDGGHVTGYLLTKEMQQDVEKALDKFAEENDGLQFAVGDGNHSLAAAKACYERDKNPLNRYALVEIENVHNSAQEFESIFRVLFNVDADNFLEEFKDYTDKNGMGGMQKFKYYMGEEEGEFEVKATAKLPVGTLQGFIDLYIEENPEVRVDYIHGQNVVKKLAKKENTLGFIYEGIKKDNFFDAIIQDGSLPRKTFSMNEADEKRFYIETRKIK
ncbi:MAG: DUF1015 domain-containing protein [Eubacterium sp.]|nr:DUF1015 domain-containing protein [Eubacterium sp.]